MRIAATAVRDRTPFIGRERERLLLIQDIREGRGLLIITGPSGIGKTRLARRIAGDLASSFQEAGGTWFCSLAPCRSTADVEAAVARSLGIPKNHGEDLADAIANRGRLLLILDNLDPVADQVAEVLRTWLERCAELQMVATSIVPVEMDEAVRHELGPLEAEDAIALYLERAHRAWAGKLTASDQPAVEELVTRLDRIPLAIELAAARIRVFPPRALLSRFADRFQLLRSGAPGRHGSLLEALTLTWELLPPQEQAILAKASVFEGGFSFDAAVAVLEDPADQGEILAFLDDLRSKALLQLEDSDQPRFQLFESVREYAAKMLADSGLEEEALRRHASFFLEQGEAQVKRIEGIHAPEAIAWLRADRENLVAIVRRSRERHPEAAARAGIVLYSLIKLEGHLPSGSHLLELALGAARRAGDPVVLMRMLDRHATTICRYARLDEAKAELEEGLALARKLEDRAEESQLLGSLAWIYLRAGEGDRSTELFDRAIALAEEAQNHLTLIHALMFRGEVAHARHAIAEAESFGARAITVAREQGYPAWEGACVAWVALVGGSQGRFQEARTALLEAVARLRQIGDRGSESNMLMNLGAVEQMAGRLDDAERYSLEGLAIMREIGNARGEATILGNIGEIAMERGEWETAEGYLLQAITYVRSRGYRALDAAMQPFLAVVQAKLGRLAEASRSMEEARSYFLEVDDRASHWSVEILMGILDLAEARRLPAGETEAIQALVYRATERLEQARKLEEMPSGNMFQALRMLERELQEWREERPDPRGEAPPPILLVGPRASWFQPPGKERVDLRRRVAIRRILNALVEKRRSSPGIGVAPFDLFEIGWPGVEIHPEHAIQRIYLGIWTLRGMGLAGLLVNQTDGYLLDPLIPVEFLDE